MKRWYFPSIDFIPYYECDIIFIEKALSKESIALHYFLNVFYSTARLNNAVEAPDICSINVALYLELSDRSTDIDSRKVIEGQVHRPRRL